VAIAAPIPRVDPVTSTMGIVSFIPAP